MEGKFEFFESPAVGQILVTSLMGVKCTTFISDIHSSTFIIKAVTFRITFSLRNLN